MKNIAAREVRRSMDLAVASAVALTVFTVATTGPNLTGLLLALDFDRVRIGLVMSMTLLFVPLQIMGAMLQRRYFHRKRFVVVTYAVQYLLFLGLAALVWNWSRMPFAAASVLFIVLFALAQGVMQLPGPVYLAWLGDLVPSRDSNDFWNRRQSWSLVAGLVAGILIGLLVDWMGRGDGRTFATVIAVGCAFAGLSLWLTAVPPDPNPEPEGRGRPFKRMLTEIWGNRSYRVLVFFFSAWNVSNWITTPFIFVYLQNDMGFSMTVIQILAAVSGVVGFLAGYLFRVLGNRYGRKPVLILCSVLKIVEFIFWGTMLPAWGVLAALPAFLLGGFVNNGIVAAQFSLLTTTGAGEKRNQSLAIGLFFAVTGLCGAGAAALSGPLFRWLEAAPWAAGLPLNTFNVLALISAGCFFLSVFLLPLLREDGAAPTTQVVRVLLTHNPFRSVYQAHVLSRPLSESFRVKTIQAARSSLVTAEMAHDLHSPSSRVRAEAVRNLAEVEEDVKGPVLEELVKLLDHPELGLQSQAAEALGRRRYRPALAALCSHALDYDGSFAQVCVWAAGQIDHGPNTLGFMRSLLADSRRRLLWPMAAECLGRDGDFHDAEAVFGAFAVEDNWVLRRQYLLALARLMVGERSQVHLAFEAEDRESVSELEKLLRRVCGAGRPGSGGGETVEARTAALRQSCDEGNYAACLEKLLPPMLAAHGLIAAEDQAAGAACLDRLFVAGQPRQSLSQRGDYASANLTLLLRLWAKLRYEENPDGKFMMLTALLALDALGKNAAGPGQMR